MNMMINPVGLETEISTIVAQMNNLNTAVTQCINAANQITASENSGLYGAVGTVLQNQMQEMQTWLNTMQNVVTALQTYSNQVQQDWTNWEQQVIAQFNQ